MKDYNTFTYFGKGFIVVRILGFGIHLKDTSRNRLSFSERNGYVKTYKIGKWSLKILTPFKK